MSYQYDSKINRELAKTALEIYMKENAPAEQPVEEKPAEETQSLQESVEASGQEEEITRILFEFVTNSCVLAEQHMGRKMNDIEIAAYAQELLENIDSMNSDDQYRLVTELMNANNG